jgi:hypothetical protein
MAVATDEIANLYFARKRSMQHRLTRMNEVKRAYEGDLELPLPELARNEKPMVANLIAQGVDQTANRIVSTMPNVTCPPLRPGFDTHESNAEDRRNALYGFWSMNRLNLIQRKRARWLITFSCAPVIIRPDPVRGIPIWQARSPLQALPPPGDDLCPVDMIFSYQRPLSWLRRIYPDMIAALDIGPRPAEVSPDTMFTLVEYCDYDATVLVAMGAPHTDDRQVTPFMPTSWTSPAPNPNRRGRPWVELERWDQRAGVCPATYPTRIGLDQPQGQFDGVIGLYWNQAMLMALEAIAVKKAIFPDRWKQARPNETVQTIVEADGMAGVVGELQGGIITDLALQPGVQTMPLMDRIERAIRLTGGIPSEMTGESASNIRTARRGAQVLSSAIDYAVQECQEIFEAALEEENTRAIAIDKAYFGRQRRAFYYSWNGTAGRGEYVPDQLWVSDENIVRYSYPGADLNELVVGTGQRLGMETMSHYRAMEIDPMIEDPNLERDRIEGESLQRAFMQGLQTQVAQGAIPPDDAAYIVSLVVAKRVPLFDAVMRAQQRAQQRQASQPSPGPGAAQQPQALPPGAPETQPGLAQPGAGAEAPSIQGPGQDAVNLQMLMQNLRRTAQPV